jgi:hypothetical protein
MRSSAYGLVLAFTLFASACSKPAAFVGMEALDDEHVALALTDGDACHIGVISLDGWMWRSEEPDCRQVEIRATEGTVAFRLIGAPDSGRLLMASLDGKCRVELRDARFKWRSPWTAASSGRRRIDVLGESQDRLVTSFSTCGAITTVDVPPSIAWAHVEPGYLAFELIGGQPGGAIAPSNSTEGAIEIRPSEGSASYQFAAATVKAYGPTALIYRRNEGPWHLHDVADRRHLAIDLDLDSLGLLRVVWQREDSLVVFTERADETTLIRVSVSDGTVTARQTLAGTIGGRRKDTPTWRQGDASLGLLWHTPGAPAPDALLSVDSDLQTQISNTGTSGLFAQVGPIPVSWTMDGRLHLLRPGQGVVAFTTLPAPGDTDRLATTQSISGRSLWWRRGNEMNRIDLETGAVELVVTW